MEESPTYLQSAWSYWMLEFRDELSAPAFPTLLAVAVYFFANIPFMAVDLAASDWSQVCVLPNDIDFVRCGRFSHSRLSRGP